MQEPYPNQDYLLIPMLIINLKLKPPTNGVAIWSQKKFTISVFNEIQCDKLTFGVINVTLSWYIIAPVPMLSSEIFLANSPILFFNEIWRDKFTFGMINVTLS